MITALVLAAGQSRRMGRPKMPLPWGERTVLGQVIHTLQAAGIQDVLVVSGSHRAEVEQIAREAGARCVFNPEHAAGEMLSSLQAGLDAMPVVAGAALIALGDQPQIEERTVRRLIEEYDATSAPLIVPSHRMRRGHPWLVRRALWAAILGMRSPETPRDFLTQHGDEIAYVEVDTPTILQDLDTPGEYEQARDQLP